LNRHARRKEQKLTGKVSHEQITSTFTRAVEHHRAGDLAGAEELYRRVVAWSPDSPEPWNFLGAIALARGDMAKAEQRYAKALALKRDWPEALNAHGNALHALGRFEEAARDFRRAVDVDAGYHQAWNSLGISLQRNGDLVQAGECFNRACELAPRTPRYLYNLGLNEKHREHFAEARAAFSEALETDDAYVDAVGQMAHCFRLEGNDEEAVRWYRKYLELAPEDTAGAGMFLAARAGDATVPAPSAAYIRRLFDGYAETFGTSSTTTCPSSSNASCASGSRRAAAS
jgi:Flp pilus assembly protein TadD